MKNILRAISVLLLSVPLVAGLPLAAAAESEALRLPYREAGLDAERAAAVLLDRFAYGARPGDVRKVVELGHGRWLEQQLAAVADEAMLEKRLAQFPALGLTHQALFAQFPSGAQSTAHARRFYDLVPPAACGIRAPRCGWRT
jgi:hypothetical protein